MPFLLSCPDLIRASKPPAFRSDNGAGRDRTEWITGSSPVMTCEDAAVLAVQPFVTSQV
jgi:hypothetical protein